MNPIFCLIVYTFNVLGIFNDPFEYEGDYGSDMNPIRQKVFEAVVSKEKLAGNLSDEEIRQLLHDNDASVEKVQNYRNALINHAIEQEIGYGPTLSELVTPDLIDQLKIKQKELQDAGFTENDLQKILAFIETYKEKKIFRFFRNTPPKFLSLDKSMRDKAAREGKGFDLPLLSSTGPLYGKNSIVLKKELLDVLFVPEYLHLAKPKVVLTQSIDQLDDRFLHEFFGDHANKNDLEAFSSPAGQIFFYWMYESLNLELVSTDPSLINQIDQMKEKFVHTIGDPLVRATQLKEGLLASDCAVLFTQESDGIVPKVLLEDNFFLPIDGQNASDGTFVFLRSDQWESDYQAIPMEEYKGRINIILAMRKGTKEKFLLASCHGNSTDPSDGRMQITKVMEKFHQYSDGNIGLLIGIDANTKREGDVQAFREHLDRLGLVATNAGPTTIKKRMVSSQHSKVGRSAADQEDYLITLKPLAPNDSPFIHTMVGFESINSSESNLLPNLSNRSDHYPVGADVLI